MEIVSFVKYFSAVLYSSLLNSYYAEGREAGNGKRFFEIIIPDHRLNVKLIDTNTFTWGVVTFIIEMQ